MGYKSVLVTVTWSDHIAPKWTVDGRPARQLHDHLSSSRIEKRVTTVNVSPLSRIAVTVGSASLLMLGAMVSTAPASAASYSNCTQLRQDYPHGVGKQGAVDSTSRTPVTNFERNDSVYNENSDSDRDGDGIACEKK